MKDKEIEQKRYNDYSRKILIQNNSTDYFTVLGSDNFSSFLREPYLHYELLIRSSISDYQNCKLLDLCCGDGMHSFTGYKNGASVIALDYSENSILLAKKRAFYNNSKIDFRCCDVESLPFENDSFDIVTCAGSFSYIDHNVLINEVKRVLKPGGKFIVVDSFNHNIIYRFNRFIHFLKGQRSYSTLKKIPNNKLLSTLGDNFQELQVKYFGIFIFLAPIFILFLDPSKIAKLLTKLDRIFRAFRKYSFKIVFIARL